jgi:hypothetical protein
VAILRVQEEQNAGPEKESKEDPSFVIHGMQTVAQIAFEVSPSKRLLQGRSWMDE